MNIILFIIAYLISSSSGLILLKISMRGYALVTYSSIASLFLNYKFLLGLFLYVLSFIIWIYIMNRKDLSYIYPIVIGLSYGIIMLLSSLVLKEAFTIEKIIGVIIICIGVVIIASQK